MFRRLFFLISFALLLGLAGGAVAQGPGDLNGDCFVDFGDYPIIAAAWLSQDGDAEYNPYCDINPGGPDGFINARDVAVFADHWLMHAAPAAPSALTFENVTSSSIGVGWTDNSLDEIGFYIYVSPSVNQPASSTYTNSANDVNLTAAGLAPSTTYHFWVTAYNSYCESAAATGSQATAGGPLYPMSDPNNTGNWILRADMSDEFNGSSLDTNKWFKDGEGGVFIYSWPGRAPSQFAPENIRVENGKLYLTTKWDPNYPFVPDIDPDCGCPYENYTTAAVTSKNTFLYGYMEIKCKAADVSITSSFWATGDSSELDVFEFVADSKVYDNDRTYPFCVHDWDHGGRSWCDSVELPWRVGSESHVYGCEWDASGLKFYADGNLVKDAPSSEIGNVWCLDEQMMIWVDSEAFEWEGFPSPSDLPADYEIDYIRVWQK